MWAVRFCVLMDNIIRIEEIIGYSFKDKNLIVQAITHSSYANERKINIVPDYERLEFLGDAVLELTVSDFLYLRQENYKEGQMTRMRAALVCEQSLAACIKENGIYNYILLSKGEENTGGRQRESILCDVFEAIVGALYLDGGMDVAKQYIYDFLLNDWENKMLFTDSKSILQEKVQDKGQKLEYKVVKEEGPSHNKTFFVNAYIDDELIAEGLGHSKKAAEQMAAYKYLKMIGNK